MSQSLYNYFVERCAFKLGDLLLGYDVVKNLDGYREISTLDENSLAKLQTEKLAKLLDFATRSAPYYKSFGHDEDSDPRAWLKSFPVLTKPLLRAHADELLTKPKNELILNVTSGSSGVQTEVYVDKEEQSKIRAALIHWWEWTGFFLGKPMFQTGMTLDRGVIKKVKDILTKTHYASAFGLADSDVVRHLEKIEKKGGYHLGGYASSLYVIAEVAKKHELDISFDAAISWGDKMFDHYRASVESAFQTKVYENYGLNEGFMVGQKIDLDYFYIYTPSVYVEILDQNWEEVPDGEMGRVVLTKLDGYAMPLIRYYTGDLAIKLPQDEYPDQRRFAFPLLKKVVGRDTDIVYTPSGKNLIVHFFTGIFEFYPEIIQFRVIQNELASIDVEVVLSENFSQTTYDKVRFDIEKHLEKDELVINFIPVKQIPPTDSGKPQIIQSNIQMPNGYGLCE
jgi:phenylacetate-CoA ligase